MTAPNVLIGAEAGVLAEVAVALEVAAVVQPGAEIVLGVFGISQHVVPSSLPPVW